MKNRRPKRSRRYLGEALEPRHLLAQIVGVVRHDIQGSLQTTADMPGLSGIPVYLDLNNDGAPGPDEPITVTAVDDPATPDDESGLYQFNNLPPGRYVVRQDLARFDEFAAEIEPMYLQTGPLHGELQAPVGAPEAQWFDQDGPLGNTLQFDGRIDTVNRDALEDELAQFRPNDPSDTVTQRWLDLQVDDSWSSTMTYLHDPTEMPQLDIATQSVTFHAIDRYEFSLIPNGLSFGVGEAARIDRQLTSIQLFLDQEVARFQLPMQTVPGWVLEVDVMIQRQPSMLSAPRISDIVQPVGFSVVSTRTGDRLIGGPIESWQANSIRAERFGPTVELLAPNDQQFVDFWNTRDDDGDGLPNFWETPGGGFDVNQDGIVDLELAAHGADPLHKDLFIEVDAMTGFAPLPEDVDLDLGELPATGTVLDRVVHAFANAPIENPNSLSGIRLHVLVDELDVPAAPFTDADKPWHEFDAIKESYFGGEDARLDDANSGNRVAARAYAYRYALFADTQASGSSGLAELPGNDMIVSLGEWKLPREDGSFANTPEQQTGTLMHELGHTLGLRHGGHDDHNYKPNYSSVMNYHWQVPNANRGWQLDYSREQLAALDSAHLDEESGIGADPADEGRMVHVGPTPLRPVPLTGPVDWNRDGDAVDEGVDSDFYIGFQRSTSGDARTYLLPNDSLPGFETRIDGHNDWRLRPEQFAMFDDLEFGEGVHACDNPLQQSVTCHDDLTDFFTLSIATDSFEPDTLTEPIQVPLVDISDIWNFDIDDGTSTGIFNLHQLNDQDHFQVTPTSPGEVQFRLNYAPQPDQELELVVFDSTGAQVGEAFSRVGAVSVTLKTTDTEPLTVVVKNAGVEIDPAPPSDLTIHPEEANWYRLEVYTPAQPLLDGAHWFGSSATAGLPGDGGTWSDARNWTVNGTDDRAPESSLAHVFRDSQHPIIDFGQDRVVEALQFTQDATLCFVECVRELRVSSGVIDVWPDVTATVHAAIESGSTTIRKRGQGTLTVSQPVPDIAVYDGQLSGRISIEGDLTVGPRGIINVASDSSVSGETYLAGTIRLDVVDGYIETEQIRYAPSSLLQVSASEPVGSRGSHVRKTVLEGSTELATFEDLESIAAVAGIEATPLGARDHLGLGVFLSDTNTDDDRIELELYQANYGDVDGDGRFDSTDLVLAFASGTYETAKRAGWLDGDFDNDGLFTSTDLILGMQTGSYEAGPFASPAANDSIVASAIERWFMEEDEIRKRRSK